MSLTYRFQNAKTLGTWESIVGKSCLAQIFQIDLISSTTYSPPNTVRNIPEHRARSKPWPQLGVTQHTYPKQRMLTFLSGIYALHMETLDLRLAVLVNWTRILSTTRCGSLPPKKNARILLRFHDIVLMP